MASRILYITFNGVLQPLGESQVLRYVEALVERGFPYDLLSFEHAADLDTPRRMELARRLEARGIGWTALPYRHGGARAVGANLTGAFMAASRQHHLTERVGLVHARSYLAAMVGLALRQTWRVPYLFDTRGYWVDESLDEGRWFTRPDAYRVAKRFERMLYGRASAVVTLTEIAAGDIRGGLFGAWPAERPLEVVTTCADFDRFGLDSPTAAVPESVQRRLAGKVVVAFIGSLNASYRPDAAFSLFRCLREIRDDVHLLCLTHQVDQVREQVRAHRIRDEDVTLTTARFEEMPAWLRLVDWGFLLLNESFAKRASMPTKLGEFLASGVRPIYFGCNDEVGEWVRRAGSGVILDGLEGDSLKRAARTMAQVEGGAEAMAQARAIAAPHFALSYGVSRYAELLDRLA